MCQQMYGTEVHCRVQPWEHTGGEGTRALATGVGAVDVDRLQSGKWNEWTAAASLQY